jgi:hypothetical protein
MTDAQARVVALALVPFYLRDAVNVATFCDEVADRSGRLLGYLREEVYKRMRE